MIFESTASDRLGRCRNLDSSAYVKLLLHEPERDALLAVLASYEGYVSSALLAVESIRACGRYGTGYARDARAWLEGIALLPLDDATLDAASSLAPRSFAASMRCT